MASDAQCSRAPLTENVPRRLIYFKGAAVVSYLFAVAPTHLLQRPQQDAQQRAGHSRVQGAD